MAAHSSCTLHVSRGTFGVGESQSLHSGFFSVAIILKAIYPMPYHFPCFKMVRTYFVAWCWCCSSYCALALEIQAFVNNGTLLFITQLMLRIRGSKPATSHVVSLSQDPGSPFDVFKELQRGETKKYMDLRTTQMHRFLFLFLFLFGGWFLFQLVCEKYKLFFYKTCHKYFYLLVIIV